MGAMLSQGKLSSPRQTDIMGNVVARQPTEIFGIAGKQMNISHVSSAFKKPMHGHFGNTKFPVKRRPHSSQGLFNGDYVPTNADRTYYGLSGNNKAMSLAALGRAKAVQAQIVGDPTNATNVGIAPKLGNNINNKVSVDAEIESPSSKLMYRLSRRRSIIDGSKHSDSKPGSAGPAIGSTALISEMKDFRDFF